jgi:hypothetical protein
VGVRSHGEEERRARLGWTAAVLALCMQACTVHYWGAMHSFFYFMLGLGAWMVSISRHPMRLGDAARPAAMRLF